MTIESEDINHQMPSIMPLIIIKPLDYLYNPLVYYPLERLSPYSRYSAVNSVVWRLKWIHRFSAVTSVNIADQASTWTLSACCGSVTPITSTGPGMGTTSSGVDQSSSSSTTTDSIIVNDKPQG